MKTTIIFLLASVLIPVNLFSQSNWTLNGNNNVVGGSSFLGSINNQSLDLRTNGTIRLHINSDPGTNNGFVGIGNNFSAPLAVLHVNGIQNKSGNVFQTTGPNTMDNTWMMSVTNYNAPRFFIRNPAGSFHVNLVTNNNGEISFFTNYSGAGGVRSMSIQGGGGGLVHGRVAMGNDLPDNFIAQSRLHLHKTTVEGEVTAGNFLQFTSTNTIGGDVPTLFSGFQIGTPNFGNDAYIRQNENSPMRFTTGGPFLERITILSNLGLADEGFVGINTQALLDPPTSRLDINGDLRIREAPESTFPDVLIVGVEHTPGNPDDLDIRRMAFIGDANKYLAGDGSWKTLPEVDPVHSELIDDLIAANKAKDELIREMSDRLSKIEACLVAHGLLETNVGDVESTPESVQDEMRSAIDITLSNKDNVVLNQNVPNPFAERTTITYYIPEYVGTAQINFFNAMGQLIRSVEIFEHGKGSLNVFGGDLSTGVYTYSLVADGKVVATKRMVRE